MKESTFEQVRKLPKVKGHLSAKTHYWPPSDPRHTINTPDVFFDDIDGEFYNLGGRVEEGEEGEDNYYFTSISISVPPGTAVGKHPIGNNGKIEARYYVSADGEDYLFRAIDGEINIEVAESNHFVVKEFRFVGRLGSAGKTVEVFLGKFDISL